MVLLVHACCMVPSKILTAEIQMAGRGGNALHVVACWFTDTRCVFDDWYSSVKVREYLSREVLNLVLQLLLKCVFLATTSCTNNLYVDCP